MLPALCQGSRWVKLIIQKWDTWLPLAWYNKESKCLYELNYSPLWCAGVLMNTLVTHYFSCSSTKQLHRLTSVHCNLVRRLTFTICPWIIQQLAFLTKFFKWHSVHMKKCVVVNRVRKKQKTNFWVKCKLLMKWSWNIDYFFFNWLYNFKLTVVW